MSRFNRVNYKTRIVAFIFIVASLPFYYFAYYCPPFDYLFAKEVRLEAEIPGSIYSIEIIQEPDCIEYYTYGYVIKDNKKYSYFLCDIDDYRWRNPAVKKIGNKIYFLRGFHRINKYTPWVDVKTLELYTGGVTRNIYKMDKLEFK